ncbi:two-component sensor histidine kinase [Cellulomonas sp. WB94]|uniref:sensor histidine kinase n=1 Tax=Cellulomonas sp. WB94 TaxID=2173174 RepID=UPI000D57D18C|nr:ATP-binding protein [Cellulomonas sp. WB94]PVU84020.1 two-component sensor histidine kinase [Cellulomonas sp. WB94]
MRRRRRHHRAAPAPRRARRHLTVRARVLSAVLLLAALAVLIAGAAASALQAQRTDARIDDSLRRAVDILRTDAASGPQPEKAQAEFTTVEDLLHDAVQRRGLTENEGVIAFLDGAPHWLASSSVPLRLEADAQLVRVLGAIPPGSSVELRTVTTAVTQYRLVAIPVAVTGDPHTGLFVVAVDRGAEVARLTATYATYAIVTIGSLLIIAVVAWLVVGRLLSPVRLLRDTARQITESDLSERIPVTGKDDLSDLARTVNDMLDRLQSAFGSQRELLDDVGHELRTPLTIVRGHLELLDPDDPDDVRATQALALDELDRMRRLVDDLVTLATADRPDFVRPAPTDVGRLTDDVLDKARGLGRRRWQVAARADATVNVDSQRITQAWLQLLANAVRFSAEGTTIRIGSEVTGERVLFWVRDEGPGVPAGEVDAIFERFQRGRADRTRRRADGGVGLGLPIVAAIAAAHHGTVRVEEPPPASGTGAVFVLDLPAVGLALGGRFTDIELQEQI